MYGLQLAFKTYHLKGFSYGNWVGFEHFIRMFSESEFTQAFWNTIIISFQKILIGFPFPIALALMINEIRYPKYKKVLQTVFTFPHFLSWVILAGICLNLFGDSGAIKKLVTLVNPQAGSDWNFLYNSKTFRGFIVGSDMWKEAGWGTIIYLAAIAGVDPSLNEAATIDGCNRFQRILYVTIPCIMGIIVIQLLLRIGAVMHGSFNQIFNIYSAPVFPVADTIDTFIYRTAFQRQIPADFGYTTAVGLFKNVINFTLLIGANKLARMFGHDGII